MEFALLDDLWGGRGEEMIVLEQTLDTSWPGLKYLTLIFYQYHKSNRLFLIFSALQTALELDIYLHDNKAEPLVEKTDMFWIEEDEFWVPYNFSLEISEAEAFLINKVLLSSVQGLAERSRLTQVVQELDQWGWKW